MISIIMLEPVSNPLSANFGLPLVKVKTILRLSETNKNYSRLRPQRLAQSQPTNSLH